MHAIKFSLPLIVSVADNRQVKLWHMHERHASHDMDECMINAFLHRSFDCEVEYLQRFFPKGEAPRRW